MAATDCRTLMPSPSSKPSFWFVLVSLSSLRLEIQPHTSRCVCIDGARDLLCTQHRSFLRIKPPCFRKLKN